MKFWLGTQYPKWLGEAGVPLFLNVRQFTSKVLPKAIAPWALDSGAFTELVTKGRWVVSPVAYAARARELQLKVGMLKFAGPQDWICSPNVLDATGLDVATHQINTVKNYLELCRLAPDIYWLPTLQGWAPRDYLAHVALYADADVDLTALPLVGIGSIAGRQDDPLTGRIIRHLADLGIRLHGFGVKKTGLKMYGDALASADSQAWTFDARFTRTAGEYRPMLPECVAEYLEGKHPRRCSDCLRYALKWRLDVLEQLDERLALAGQDALFASRDEHLHSHEVAERRTRHGMRNAVSNPGYEKAGRELGQLWEGE